MNMNLDLNLKFGRFEILLLANIRQYTSYNFVIIDVKINEIKICHLKQYCNNKTKIIKQYISLQSEKPIIQLKNAKYYS